MKSLIIVLSFISSLPIPQRFIPDWNERTLKYFCPMLALSGAIFGSLWLFIWIAIPARLSGLPKGFAVMFLTLALTGGLHMDGLMDTCDAIFSHRDRQTRLAILSDTHSGSFAVMGCVIILLGKVIFFSENLPAMSMFFVPAYSRLGMAIMLNSLPFAKSGGLAVTLGASRDRRNHIFFALMALLLLVFGGYILALTFWLCLALWCLVCVRTFGGITGDLLGAFVELSELIMLGVSLSCT